MSFFDLTRGKRNPQKRIFGKSAWELYFFQKLMFDLRNLFYRFPPMKRVFFWSFIK